jgi:uncharacterized protein involved in exopolysaccharide biosynthesis
LPELPTAKRTRTRAAKRNQPSPLDMRVQPDPTRVQPDAGHVQHGPDRVQPYPGDEAPSTSIRSVGAALIPHRRLVVSFVGGLLAACILYCLIAPNEYEASARIALRSSPATTLNLDGTTGANSGAFASEQTQLETLANVFRSDRLGWAVITDQSLYRAPGFAGSFERRFPGFRMGTPGPEAQAYLLDRFHKRLNVRTLPRTLILQIRFRSNDPALSAAVVNGLIRLYNQQETAARSKATEEASVLLTDELNALKSRVTDEDKRLLEFQQNHGLLDTPEILANGQPGDPSEREHMSVAGRAWVLEHFTDQRLFGLTTSFYQGLLKPGAVGVAREEPAMELAVRLR